MTGAISWAPLLPLPVIALFGAIGLGLVLVSLARRARGAVLRASILTLLLLALLGPTLVGEKSQTQNDIAVALIDKSPSQRTGDREDRAKQALAELETAIASQDDLELRIVEVPGAGADGSEGTRMVGALEKAAATVPAGRFAGAVMISDGQIHDGPEILSDDGVGGPVHLLLTGKPNEQDRRVLVESIPSYGIVGKEITLTYRIEDNPRSRETTNTPEAVSVTIRRDGEEIAKESASINTTNETTILLEHAGPTIVELEVEALRGELSQINNRAVVAVNGVRDRLRVLLVSGQPHLGERTWRNLFKSDPAVDLVHFTILRPPDKDDFTPLRELALIAFPTQELFEKRIDEFDLIVFDRYVVRFVLPPIYFENITNYVREGGAVLFAVGPEFAGVRSLADTPLADLMPARPTGEVIETEFRPRQTETGRRHPVTAALPASSASADVEPAWGRWFRQIEGNAESGSTLLEGPDGLPLLVLDRVGEGRVAQMMSDHIWLWARGYDGGGPHAEVIRRVAHWLMKEPDLEEEALRAVTQEGKLLIERRSLDPTTRSVEVTTPSDKQVTVELPAVKDGRFEASVTVEEPGLYRISDGQQGTMAAVGALNALEFADLRATADPLAPLIRATGGGAFWIEDGIPDIRRILPGRDTAGRNWLGLRRNGAELVTGITQTPLLPWWLFLPLGLGLLGLAWWREGR
ncbi:MAG: hypothetical protein MI741_03640 [Rhodospirillales bacterium]|nr:hypothetical protein [Rhodospirillales bacterium]